MRHTFASLEHEPFPRLYATFQEAFADYGISQSTVTEERLRNRMVKNGVDYAASFGSFDGGRMTGLMLVGRGEWRGHAAAFDALTGVVPGYRGRGIGGYLFERVVARLREQGVATFVLEVLQDNTPAVRTYRRAGFRTTREFDCFALEPGKHRAARPPAALGIRRVGREVLDLFEPLLDWSPSWENSFASMRRIPDELVLLAAFEGGAPAGLLAYYPGLGWITSLLVHPARRRRGIASALLSHLLSTTPLHLPAVKVVDVESGDAGMARFLAASGFELFARQFEMELDVPSFVYPA